MKYIYGLFLILFLGCFETATKNKNNQLKLALTNSISTLDPAVSYDTVSAEVVYQVHEPLYEYEYLKRPYSLKPLLAQSLPQITNGGKTYTFSIKKNIPYHPHKAFKNKKRTLKSIDFINAIKRIAYQKTQSTGWWLFNKRIVGLNEFRSKAKEIDDIFSLEVQGLKVLDEHSFQIQLTKPHPQFLYSFAMAFTAPTPEEIIRYFKNDLSQHPIGTGPFKFKKWDKNLSVELTKFKDYHPMFYPKQGDRYSHERNLLKDAGKRLPFIDGIKFHIVKEAQTRWLSFLKKKFDFIILTKDHFAVALDANGSLKEEFAADRIHLQISPTLTYWWVSFNMKDPILGANKKLREAIAHAIDYDEFIKVFTNNIGQRANSIYPPGIPGYRPSAELPYQFNLDKAKELIKKAGYPKGKGLPEFNYDVRGASTVSRQMGEFVKNQLAKIGIKVNVIVNTFPGFLNKSRTGQLQFWQDGWALDYPDSENVIQLLTTKNHSPGPNATYFSNPQIDKMYDQLGQVTERSENQTIMNKVEKIVLDELPWVMLFYSRNYVLFHKHVGNFRQSDLIYNNYKYIKLGKSN